MNCLKLLAVAILLVTFIVGVIGMNFLFNVNEKSSRVLHRLNDCTDDDNNNEVKKGNG